MGLMYRIKKSIEIDKNNAIYEELMPMIAEETRMYIKKMSNSGVITELAEELLKGGFSPESLTVSESYISTDRKHGTYIKFEDIGLPKLQSVHKYSKEIDHFFWSSFCEENSSRTYMNRFMASLKQGGVFKSTYPDVFGISLYDLDSEGDIHHPCINECVVVGVLICRIIGENYIGKDEGHYAEFIRKRPITRSWY